MKTNRHILNASNLFLCLYNDKQLGKDQKTVIASCIESMLLEFYESNEYNITDLDVKCNLFKERTISIIENFNNNYSIALKQ